MLQKLLQRQAIATDSLTINLSECLKYPSLGEIVVEDVLKDLEIDSLANDEFGTIYRIWSESKLLGTFYQELDGQWVAQPNGSEDNWHFRTPEKAQLSILAVKLADFLHLSAA